MKSSTDHPPNQPTTRPTNPSSTHPTTISTLDPLPAALSSPSVPPSLRPSLRPSLPLSGVKLQADDPLVPGFLPVQVYERVMHEEATEGTDDDDEDEEGGLGAGKPKKEKNVICQRCFKLRNYGQVDQVQYTVRPHTIIEQRRGRITLKHTRT